MTSSASSTTTSGRCLVPVAIGGQLVTAGLTILLAGRLAVVEFQAYVVAASLFLVMANVAPLGADKLALRVLPPLLRDGDDGRVAGFLRFALRRVAWGVLVVGCVGLVWGLLSAGDAAARRAVVLSVVAVPFGALARLGLEVMTATGMACAGTAIMRLLVPALVLGLVVAMSLLGALSGPGAIAAWGLAWIVAVALMGRSLGGRRPPLRVPPVTEAPRWRAEARPLWLYRLAVALQAQAGLLALGWFGGAAAGVGAYAAAAAITAPMLVLATATNRAYARDIAVLVDRDDAEGLAALLRARRRWMMPALALFVAVAWVFAGPLLAVFRPEFAEIGRWPVRILATTSAVTIYLSLAPTILKYRDHNALVFRTVLLATMLQILLLAILVPPLGPTGAALGTGIASALMYARFARAARAGWPAASR